MIVVLKLTTSIIKIIFMAKSTSDIDNLIKAAFDHAIAFYNSHNRSLDNQRICIEQMMSVSGFDFDTCVKIQSPILSLLMMNETIQIGNEMIQNQLRIVSGIIRDHFQYCTKHEA